MEIKLIQRDIKKSKQTQRKYWFAECPYCGKIFSARYNDLIKGHTKSCGCLSTKKDGSPKQKYTISEGDIFGSLRVLYETKHDKKGHGFFLCECQCGNVTEVRRDMLISGRTISCGCKRFQSKGQELIKKILQQNNISFVKEKTFDSCRFPDTKYPARFDFYVNNQYLIEFDGQQHFKTEPSKSGFFTKERLEKIKEHDQFKNQWCKQNNIPLIRIPYTKLESLTLKDLLL